VFSGHYGEQGRSDDCGSTILGRSCCVSDDNKYGGVASSIGKLYELELGMIVNL
jgi:hypothetical protein